MSDLISRFENAACHIRVMEDSRRKILQQKDISDIIDKIPVKDRKKKALSFRAKKLSCETSTDGHCQTAAEMIKGNDEKEYSRITDVRSWKLNYSCF